MSIVEMSFEYMTEFFLKSGIESSLRSIALSSMGKIYENQLVRKCFRVPPSFNSFGYIAEYNKGNFPWPIYEF